jgi:colanic acid biosynthesis protein WcaH
MWLKDEQFRDVVTFTPLVSIDFVVQNSSGKILLGQRLNRPAQGFWFVPGGRIHKNESLDVAFSRLALNELGVAFERSRSRLLGVYEHFYADSIFGSGSADPNTHYVVLGYHLQLPDGMQLVPPQIQHDRYRWCALAEIHANSEVHSNTRAYLEALG